MTGKNIVKNTYLQQVDGGLAECVTIIGKCFNSGGGFFSFFLFE
jgi:hypothetical protein